MLTVDVREAEAQLEWLSELAKAGAEIAIARGGRPVARLFAAEPQLPVAAAYGAMAGEIVVSDDFNEVPEELSTYFSDGRSRPEPPLRFRNVEAAPSDPVDRWPYEGLVAVIERGGLSDWRRIIAELDREPRGRTAGNLEQYLADAEPTGATLPLARALKRARAAG